MAFTKGTATFTNGSTAVTAVSLTSGRLSYFASGTRMVVGTNPVVAEVEAIDAPAVNAITLREPWAFATGTYAFLANMTSEGVRDAVQNIRESAETLQQFIDSIEVNPVADSVVQRDERGAVKSATAVDGDDAVVLSQLPDGVADLYARNNVLGTVSQVAGVPTGAIIERGSNANGEYVKYADGTIILFGTKQFTGGVATSYGNSFRTSGFNIVLPSSISLAYPIGVSGVWNDDDGNTGLFGFSSATSSQIIGAILISVVSLPADTRYLYWHLSARWY